MMWYVQAVGTIHVRALVEALSHVSSPHQTTNLSIPIPFFHPSAQIRPSYHTLLLHLFTILLNLIKKIIRVARAQPLKEIYSLGTLSSFFHKISPFALLPNLLRPAKSPVQTGLQNSFHPGPHFFVFLYVVPVAVETGIGGVVLVAGKDEGGDEASDFEKVVEDLLDGGDVLNTSMLGGKLGVG